VNTPVLVVSSVARKFRRGGRSVPAVGGVSLELVPGEVAALVGPHGSGKTTLLRIAAGLLAPDAGTAIVAGAPAGSPPARAATGYAPQAPVFPPTLRVREVLDYVARFHTAGVRRRALVAEALERAGLAESADRRAAALPLPFARRLALALAALGERRVLLLDETLSGSDAPGRRAMCDRLRELAARGVALLLASSDLAAVERLAARVLVLCDGRIVRDAPVAALLGERVLEILLDAPPESPPPGFRVTAYGLETDLGVGSAEAALALCRVHRLAVRASRVCVRSLEDVVLRALGDSAR
jgi:ABC-2 type transport system ATP-binding protein